MTGEIPAELGNLTSLHWLDLGRNRLTGAPPAALGRLTSLYTLDLGQNDLTAGPIPGWLGSLAGLSALSLSRANVTGPLPVWLGNLANLQRVDLSYNWGLAGPLPSSLDLSHLERIDVFATRACAPAAWLSWLGAIDFTGAFCGADADGIDVAVFHTPAARDAAGGLDGIDAVIDLYIAETNRAFEESGVRTRIALVAREEVDYAETDEYDKDIDRLRNPSDGHLDGVHAVRDRVGADLVHLIVAELDVCGVAELGGAFGITRHGCGGRTLAHELGHNLGLHHDRYELLQRRGQALSSHPGYGYVNQRAFDAGAPPDSRWLTVMAYWTQCADNGVSCTSLLRFSKSASDLARRHAGRTRRRRFDGRGGPRRRGGRARRDRPGRGQLPAGLRQPAADRARDAAGPDAAGGRRGGGRGRRGGVPGPGRRCAHLVGGLIGAGGGDGAGGGRVRDPHPGCRGRGHDNDDRNRHRRLEHHRGATLRGHRGRRGVRVPGDAGAPSRPVDRRAVAERGRHQPRLHPGGDEPRRLHPRDGRGPRRRLGNGHLRGGPNPGAARTGALTVAGRRVTVFQASRVFTDHPLRPGMTPIKAVHFLELRARIDGVRRGLGLSAFGWTEPILTPGVTPVRRIHLMDLRTALDRAYTASGRPPPSYTDATVQAEATAIRTVHLMELRAAVAALE